MKRIPGKRNLSWLMLISLVLSGCSSTLVKDPVQHTTEAALHCSGNEWVDDSSIAVLPIPFVAFFVPQADLNEMQSHEPMTKCGPGQQIVNREIIVDRTACVPAGLTRILTLGVWQWCPTHLFWEADVLPLSNRSPQQEEALSST